MSTNEAEQEHFEFPKLGRFSLQQVLVILISWVILYALGTLFVANPFFTESSAGADINYFNTMYLHGMLISLVGFLALAICQVFSFHSKHARDWIFGGIVAAVILATVGGFLNTSDKTPLLWVQVFSYFALDDILISLLIAFVIEVANRSEVSRHLPFWTALVGNLGLLAAAVMGHFAGWILTFGNWPGFIGAYAKAVGEKPDDLMGNLIGAHSHLMIVSVLAVLVAISAWRFGYQALKGGPRALARLGFWIVAAGTAVILVMYLVAGFTAIQPPTWFQSGPNGVNGIASDDVISGVGIMLGGLLVLLAMLFSKRGAESQIGWLKPALAAIGTAWISLVLLVVGGGYYIELHENLFGAGNKAPLAAADAVFTFMHQDYAFFILPGVMVLLLFADIFLKQVRVKTIATGAIIGVLVALVGCLIYVFADPTVVYGAGYFIVAIGLVVLVVTAVLFIKSLTQAVNMNKVNN